MSHSQDPATPQAPVNPNDDGFVLGTAGRDEDPNAAPSYAIDRRHERDELTPKTPVACPAIPRKSQRLNPRRSGLKRQSRESRRLSRGTIRLDDQAAMAFAQTALAVETVIFLPRIIAICDKSNLCLTHL